MSSADLRKRFQTSSFVVLGKFLVSKRPNDFTQFKCGQLCGAESFQVVSEMFPDSSFPLKSFSF